MDRLICCKTIPYYQPWLVDCSSLCAVFVAMLKLISEWLNFRPGALYQNAAGRELTVMARLKQTDDSSSNSSSTNSSSSSSNSVTLLAATSFKADDPTGLWLSLLPLNSVVVQIRIGIKTISIHMRILPQVLHILETKNFSYLHTQKCLLVNVVGW
jgi:hypothetical protein